MGPSRVTTTADRDRPGTYVSIVEFDSYEHAMSNSEHPATQELADTMASFCDSPPTFRNLDVERQEIRMPDASRSSGARIDA